MRKAGDTMTYWRWERRRGRCRGIDLLSRLQRRALVGLVTNGDPFDMLEEKPDGGAV
jgi:hypothetical protein